MEKKSDALDVTICQWAGVRLVRCGEQAPGTSRYEVIEPDHVAFFSSAIFPRPLHLALLFFVCRALAAIDSRKEALCCGE